MSIPPKSTIYFVDLPAPNILQKFSLGIDLNFFNFDTSLENFKGIKLINSGIHFFHYNNLSLGIRFGSFIRLLENHVYFMRWNEELEEFEVFIVDSDAKLVYHNCDKKKRKIQEVEDVDLHSLNVSKWVSEIPRNYQFMINYEGLSQQSNYLNRDWEVLTSKVTMTLINEIFPKNGDQNISSAISTLDSSKQENDKLLTAIRESVSRKFIEQEKDLLQVDNEPLLKALQSEKYKELNFTEIEFKRTQRPNATPLQITQDSMDKSWYLDNLLNTSLDENSFLGEFQVCFITLMVLNNYSSGGQWMNMIQILLMSFNLLNTRISLYIQFIKMLNIMLKKLPMELVEEEKEGIVKLYDKDFLKVLKEYQRNLFYDVSPTPEVKQLQKLTLELFEIFRLKFDLLISLDDDEDDEDEYNDYV